MKNIAHIVAVNMGYGHQRPAYTLRQFAKGGKIIIANDYPGIPSKDKKLWNSGREIYEKVSRFKNVPIIGPVVFGLMDELQEIPAFYPRRDLSRPSLQVYEFYALIRKRGFMKHLIEKLAKNPKPLLCTFMTPAFAAEEFGYLGEIYVLATDADISRAWAPFNPQKSRIRYFAPNGRVVERLKLYGVPESNIELTGFPLPMNAIGGEDTKYIYEDLARRICRLDKNRIFVSRSQKTLVACMGEERCKVFATKKNGPISIAFLVGGAGAQQELAIDVVKSLRRLIAQNVITMTLVAGSRQEVASYFEDQIKKIGLLGALKKKQLSILFDENRERYFSAMEKSIRSFDILWTKPSEMSFYTGLGLPIIMTPTVGSQEDYNRNWLMQVGGGIDGLDIRYANEWLMDWVHSGALARMAWQGFVEAPTHGAYRIADILAGRPNTIHELPLVV